MWYVVTCRFWVTWSLVDFSVTPNYIYTHTSRATLVKSNSEQNKSNSPTSMPAETMRLFHLLKSKSKRFLCFTGNKESPLGKINDALSSLKGFFRRVGEGELTLDSSFPSPWIFCSWNVYTNRRLISSSNHFDMLLYCCVCLLHVRSFFILRRLLIVEPFMGWDACHGPSAE